MFHLTAGHIFLTANELDFPH